MKTLLIGMMVALLLVGCGSDINADQSKGPIRLLFAVNPSVAKEVLLPVAPEQLGEVVLIANSEKVSTQGLQDNFARKDGFLRLPSVSSAMWTIG